MAKKVNKSKNAKANVNRAPAGFYNNQYPPLVGSGSFMYNQRAPMARNAAPVGKKKKKRVDPKNQYKIKKEKRVNKGRDYFYVMRKFFCFLIFLLLAVTVAIFPLGYLKIFPNYIALFIEPDYTPKEERISTEVDGEIVAYQDKSVYFSAIDPISGFIKKFTGKELLGASPKYDETAQIVENGVADKIAPIIMTYYPVALVLFVIIALISTVKALFAIFGRRIYKRFGLSALLMIICAAVVVLGAALGNMDMDAKLDFTKLVPFLISAIITPADLTTAPLTAAGYGMLGMIGIPVLVLLLSILAKKKVPFSIFD